MRKFGVSLILLLLFFLLVSCAPSVNPPQLSTASAILGVVLYVALFVWGVNLIGKQVFGQEGLIVSRFIRWIGKLLTSCITRKN